MKRICLPLFFILLLITGSCKNDVQTLDELIDEQMNFAVKQYSAMYASLPEEQLPRSTDNSTGNLVTSGTGWWCSGFFPGSLWYLYEYSRDEELKKMAMQKTELIAKEQFNTGTHDLGFMIYNSYGQGLRISGNEEYKEVLINGAYSLLSRYNETVGCIRSWDHGSWTFPVIIDNMMNLEYLLWAFGDTRDSTFYRACISHSNNTITNHFREDYSSYHLVDYDTISGEVLKKQTVQGFSDESAWARGQSWGLYGFVSMYRITGIEKYLQQAVHIAEFLLDHPNMPADGIPYWDYNAPNIPEAKRDASAGAILASGLADLSNFVDGAEAVKYRSFAEKIIRTLASDVYRSDKDDNNNFLLKHSVGSLPGKSEVDVPLSYADYYFIEAMMRLRSSKG